MLIVHKTIRIPISGSTKLNKILRIWKLQFNWISGVVFKTKELNSNKLSKNTYAILRKNGLPSQLSASLCRTICAVYKIAKSNNRWTLAKAQANAFPVVYRRDFSRTRKGITLWGELLTVHDTRPLPTGKWKDSKVKLIGSQWYLLLCYEVEVPDPKSDGCLVGVDMGLKRMLVATNSANSKTFFFHGGVLNHRRSCIRRTRAAVQTVGSRSARRLLKRMARKEAAVTEHLLHVASKALVSYATTNGARRIVLEDLTNIRDSSVSKGKDLRSKVHRWPYAKARFFISYKAQAVGIETEVVSPKNTSRGCSRCGHVSASNRKGLLFCCKKCGHQEDADRQASTNIRQRSISIAHNAAGMRSHNSLKSSELSEMGARSSDSFADLVSV